MTDDDEFVYVPISREGGRDLLRLYDWVKEQKQLPFIPSRIHRLAEMIRASMNQGCMKHHLLMAKFKKIGHNRYIVVCPKCESRVYNQLKGGDHNGSQYEMLRDVDEYKELFII